MRLRSPLAGLALVLLWLALLFWNLGQWDTQPTDLAWIVKRAVRGITEVVLWTAAWAWVTFVLRGQSRLAEHVVVVALACLVDEAVISLGLPWLFFAMGWPWPPEMHKTLWALLACGTAYVQLTVALPKLSPKHVGLWLLASALALWLNSLQLWAEHNDREALRKLPYEANIFPPVGLGQPALDLDKGLDALWQKAWPSGHE